MPGERSTKKRAHGVHLGPIPEFFWQAGISSQLDDFVWLSWQARVSSWLVKSVPGRLVSLPGWREFFPPGWNCEV